MLSQSYSALQKEEYQKAYCTQQVSVLQDYCNICQVLCFTIFSQDKFRGGKEPKQTNIKSIQEQLFQIKTAESEYIIPGWSENTEKYLN